jgi:hypothetical protein
MNNFTAPMMRPEQVWAAVAPELAGCPLMRLGIWLSTEGKWDLKYLKNTPLTHDLPKHPAAVRVYDDDQQCRALFFDFDAKLGNKELVKYQANALIFLLEGLSTFGISSFTDVSPNGGRHVYVLLDEPVNCTVVKPLVKAIALRFNTLDPSPHTNAPQIACCRTPGSRHKTRGHYQTLITPWQWVAAQIANRNNTVEVIAALETEFAEELAAVSESAPLSTSTPSRKLFAEQVQAILAEAPANGRISARMRELARSGDYQAAGYKTKSHGTQAVLTAFIAAGYDRLYLQRRIEQGTLPGLVSMYGPKYHRRFLNDFTNASNYVAKYRKNPGNAGQTPFHQMDTSGLYNTPAGAKPSTVDEKIRTWATTLLQFETTNLKDAGYATRLLARQIAAAAHSSQSLEIEWGCRNLSINVNISHQATAIGLKTLATRGWLEKIGHACDPARDFRNADRYRLTIPERYSNMAEILPWHKGKIYALRPAFLMLGTPAALAFEAIEMGRAKTIQQIMEVTGLSESTSYQARNLLEFFGLISSEKANSDNESTVSFVAHPGRLEQVSEELGCDEIYQAKIVRNLAMRRVWHEWLEIMLQRWLNSRNSPSSTENLHIYPPWTDEQPESGMGHRSN